MITIALPMGGQTKFIGRAIVGASTLLVLSCPIAWPWRGMAALAILATGLLLWRSFLKRRPVGLVVAMDRGLTCLCADGRVLEITDVRPGVVRPALVCARLEAGPEGHCDLFVPGRGISRRVHWQLRRALIDFRAVQADARRGM